jgi:hypothetical protein
VIVPWRPAQRSPIAIRDSAELYETPACATRALIETGELDRFIHGVIWEPCAGKGAIVRELRAGGFRVHATDLIDYDGADAGILAPINFLEKRAPAGVSAIVTNPPYGQSDRFIRHAISLGLPVIVLLRLQALEGVARSDIVDRHLRRIWAGRQRLPMMHRDGWTGPRTRSGGAPFAWFVFMPGARRGPIEVQRIIGRRHESARYFRGRRRCDARLDDAHRDERSDSARLFRIYRPAMACRTQPIRRPPGRRSLGRGKASKPCSRGL